MESNKNNQLQKSLGLIFVYTVATACMFTYVSYWDSVFFTYCGPGTFLAFALMTLAILPIALVYSEISPLFSTTGGELIYNTVGLNKHAGFFSSWLIMAAWISVPPAVVMAIATYISKLFHLQLSFYATMGIGLVILVLVFVMSLQDIQFLVKAQAACLFANIVSTLITGILLLCSGHWHFEHLRNLFSSKLDSSFSIPAWVIGMALLITPYFGFETVPQMVEEGEFPISNTKRAITGSVLTCGAIYTFFFFCVAGLGSFDTLLSGDAFRYLAMIIMLAIAFFCTLGQGIGSWISFAVYMGVGVVIWLWMVLLRWKSSPVIIETPAGVKKY